MKMTKDMVGDYDDDEHFCLKCQTTILGLDNYVNHRRAGCSKSLTAAPKSPEPAELLVSEESFNLKADDFFSSLELRSSTKKVETQPPTGKTPRGILTRSKTTAAIQATAGASRDATEPQQSKSGKNVWIGGDQLKELGQGDNQSKLITAVANLERRKEEPTKLQNSDDSDEDSEAYDSDEDGSSSDDREVPPGNYTGGKWKPSSPVGWKKSGGWSAPPATHTGGKWKPTSKRSCSPSTSYTKGKDKMSYPQKYDDNIPPPTFTGSKWVSNKKQDYVDVPPPSFTGSKWISSKRQDYHGAPSSPASKEKWKAVSESESSSSSPPKGKSKFPIGVPSPNYTKGKWKPKVEEDMFPPAPTAKSKWKVKPIENTPPPSSSKRKQDVPKKTSRSEPTDKYTDSSTPEECYTKGKFIPITDNKDNPKIDDICPLRKSSGAIQYWCNPCNRRLASKVVYRRHLKSELHLKRTFIDREFDESDEISPKKVPRMEQNQSQPVFGPENKTSQRSDRKRDRKKIYERCSVCHTKVNVYLMGKHLISHYHCRRGDITTEVAKAMVLENIHSVVLESPFQCSICKFYCNTQEDFLRHWLSPDHLDKEAPGYFYCIMCKYRSEDSKAMYDHLVSSQHAEVVSVINRSVPIVIKKINPMSCFTCGEEFLLNVQLLNHCKKFDHDDSVVKQFRNEFVCDTCGVGLLSSVSLKRHKLIAHKVKYYICTPCNLKFSDIAKAKEHRKSAQHKYYSLGNKGDGYRTKTCEYCKESFNNFLLLKEHLQKSHPEHKIRCPHCGANFTISQELTTHLRMKSCKFEENQENEQHSLRCDKCQFTSNSTAELLFHVALHSEAVLTYSYSSDTGTDTRSKPVPKYKCPLCEKLYPKASLHPHIRQHTQEKPFVCNVCDKAFARKSNLQFHVKNHARKVKAKPVSGYRAFLCSVCGANFKRKMSKCCIVNCGSQKLRDNLSFVRIPVPGELHYKHKSNNMNALSVKQRLKWI